MNVRSVPETSDPGAFPATLRRYRVARRLSQLDLALACDISARHLSFLESGRAGPSREMVLRLAAGLVLPFSARNTLLKAAGFSATYPASPLDSHALEPVRAILADMIARHEPNPALLCDRYWTVLDANASARSLIAALTGGSGEMNIVRMLTRNPAAESAIVNLPQVLNELCLRLQLEALEAGDDPVLEDHVRALEAACARRPLPEPAAPRQPLVPLVLGTGGEPLRFHSAIAHFATSDDVTVRDLRLELLFPADDHTRAAVVALSAG